MHRVQTVGARREQLADERPVKRSSPPALEERRGESTEFLGITNSSSADASAHFSVGAACDQLALLRVAPRDALEECMYLRTSLASVQIA